jgi:uncharacterized Tic20 family protein
MEDPQRRAAWRLPARIHPVSIGSQPPADGRCSQWAAFAHLAGLFVLIVPPLGGILGPMIIWILKKDDMPFVRDQGREAINFQITMLLAMLVAGALILALVGLVLLPIVIVTDVVLILVATLAASDGRAYRYPFNLRLVP